jgi:hypothetical protein
MPEGDSVYQLSRRLQFLVGREVVATSIRVPQFALVDFTGATTDRIWPYGKHLFMQFGAHILHTHLKMEGKWAIHLKGDKWSHPGHTARVVMNFCGAPHPRPIEIVGHQLGFVRVFPASAYHERIAHLGPDVLADDWDVYGKQEALRRLLLRPERPVGTALLDQRNLAGIGNEYRAEICFLSGCHPATPVGSINMEKVVELARKLMWDNRLSPLRVTTGVRRIGESTYVFGRNHQPCRRCGTLITKSFLGGVDFSGDDGEAERVIWWCPHCQPLW